jgi:arsenic resistance protein ArsH
MSNQPTVANRDGDLNNTSAARPQAALEIDPAYAYRTFAITTKDDDAAVREKYRPFLLSDEVAKEDWVAKLELSSVLKMVDELVLQKGTEGEGRLKVLVLYGSLRAR